MKPFVIWYGRNRDTIVMTSEVAGFSEDIIKKYRKNEEVRIIITPNKEE
ncbi:MAG: hypothetical protein HFJ26_06025 [Clostridia bacterium]|nr:hypothetical protein [Clostridia bacterium]